MESWSLENFFSVFHGAQGCERGSEDNCRLSRAILCKGTLATDNEEVHYRNNYCKSGNGFAELVSLRFRDRPPSKVLVQAL